MNGNLTTLEKQNTNVDNFVFQNALAFENGQRMATALSKANLVPKEYQGNMPNCLIALEAAQRLRCARMKHWDGKTHNGPSASSAGMTQAHAPRYELTDSKGTYGLFQTDSVRHSPTN